jgi:hypothetical protein
MKAVPQSVERSEWSGRTRKLGNKYASRLNTRVCSFDRDEWSGSWNMSPDVYYMELRSFLHISVTYTLILHFAACLCYSQEVYRLTGRIYPTFIHISQWVTSIVNIRALMVVASSWGVVNFVPKMCRSLLSTQNAMFICYSTILIEGARGGAVGWGTVLQAGRLRVRFPMVSHNPSGRTVALGLTQTPTEMSARNKSWGVKEAQA